ncbi:MAG: DUF4350 domain-containing protein [Prolixibacteraceae bacterium]|jgi:hypothetical protein
MFRNNRIYLIVPALLFVVLIALNHYSPKPIDWSENYNIQGKSPYSCFVLNEMFKSIFPDQTIENTYENFYTTLDSAKLESGNVLAITSDFNPDPYDLDALLKFVARGNDFFVSAVKFGRFFSDSLKFDLSSSVIDTSFLKNEKEILFLLNPELRNDSGYYFIKRMPLVYFSAFDTIHTLKLGENRYGKTNFICMKHGLGKIYIHTQPLAFTNYNLLYGNTEYAAKALSYLPVRKTVWDNYYKPDRFVNTSPVRYILSQPALQLAYYLLLLTLLLYMLVESKRRQCIIPFIKSPENRSLQFVKTVGSLYFGQRNNADLAKKMTVYFREFLRERYLLTIISGSKDSVALVAEKSGVSGELVQQVLDSIVYYEKAEKATDYGLMEFKRRIDTFYKQCL